jgi:sporulation protein YlmC with PRC-barrel domain
MKNLKEELLLSAGNLQKTTVKTPTDEKVGTIKDVVINTDDGTIAYVVLAVDTGFLNLNSKYFAIPWTALKFDTAQEDVVIFNIDKDRLENAPGFDKDNWPKGPQGQFVNEVNTYYGIPRDSRLY